MRFGSLFTGVGGFDLGFERAGMKCAWQVENDPNCQAVLERHYPTIKKYEDVRNVGKHNLESVDLICGGFPCQDHSVAGKRAGFAGERSGLWFEYQRIVDEMRPQWVVIENVPGLLSTAKGQDFETIIRALDEFGYGVAWRVLDSQYFGVPQRRRRVFIVASLGSTSCGQVLFESEGLRGNFAPSEEEGEKTSRATTGSINENSIASLRSGGCGGMLRGFGHGWQGQHNNTNSVMVANTLAGGLSKAHSDITSGQQDGNVVLCMASGQANAEMISERSPALTGLHEQPVVVGSLQARDYKGVGNQYVNEGKVVWQMNHASEVYRESGELSPTLQSRMGTGGNNVPLIGVRRLTPVECCRLQGFPDDWNDNVSDTQRYKQMGNAVTVNVIEWIGKRIMENCEEQNAENNRTI